MALGCTSDAVIASWQAVPVFDEQAVSVYADRVGAQGGDCNWVRALAIASLRVNRLMYFKRTPGDCGTASGPSGNLGAALAQKGLQIGLNAVPVIGEALSAIVNFLPFAHHTQAVANEQGTLCDVVMNYAGFADAIEQALQNRQLGLQDAATKVDQLEAQLQQELDTIAKPINAGYGYKKCLSALVLFNKEAVYASLVPGAISGVIKDLTGSKVGVGAVAVGAGVGLAKVAGIF